MTSPLPETPVLVVDDEPEVRHLFSEVLKSAGFRSVEASTAEQAWSLLQKGLSPSAVLLDLRMPGMGGLGFLLQIRADPKYARLPVTIVTGESFIDQTTRSAVAALGATVSFKPLDIDEILSLAQKMTDKPDMQLPANLP